MERFDLATVSARLERPGSLDRSSDLVGERAAVAVVLAPRGPDDDAELLFIKRAERAGAMATSMVLADALLLFSAGLPDPAP